MHVKISEARSDYSIVQFGACLRSDPKASYQLFHCEYDKTNPDQQPKMVVVRRGKIPRKGRLRLELEYGGYYTILAQGDDIAGTIHTADKVMAAPFHLSIDAAPSQKALYAERARQQKEAEKRRPNALSRAVHAVLHPRR